MNRRNPILAVVLVWAASGASVLAADYPRVVVDTPGLVGYWRFDGPEPANSSVGGHTGLLVGNATVGAPGSGPALGGVDGNKAVLLDGTGDGVDTSLDTEAPVSTAGSIVAWINLALLPSAQGKINAVAGRSQFFNDFDLQVETDDRLKFYTDSGSSTASAGTLVANKWTMVAGTFDTGAGARTVYLDGNPVGTGVPGAHTANATKFTIGFSAVFGGRDFNGRLDEVAVFDRALTAVEIKAIYDAAALFSDGFE